VQKILSLCIAVAVLLGSATPCFASSETLNTTGKRGKLVAKSALYGFGGGLVVGLASQVVKRKTRNIFVCGSLGLYAGIILGLYVINSTGGGKAPYEGPDTYEDYSQEKTMDRLQSNLTVADTKKFQNDPSQLQLDVVNINF
jgi:hypothetical protein